jgi:hypothetical protein
MISLYPGVQQGELITMGAREYAREQYVQTYILKFPSLILRLLFYTLFFLSPVLRFLFLFLFFFSVLSQPRCWMSGWFFHSPPSNLVNL